MASQNHHRTVTVSRTSGGRFTIRNGRGGEITIGTGDDADFTPTELLLAAIGGCTAIDVDLLTTRRSEPERFDVVVDADKIRDASGNRLTNIATTFDIAFPEGERGDAARNLLPDAVQRSHDRLCTVGRTVETATEISTKVL
jgi:putative redox protein